MIGMSGVIPFLPLYVRDLGVAPADAPLWSGVIISAPFMMAALLTPLWGTLGDKYGQKAMVLRAVAGLGITVSLMGFAPNIWVLLLLRLAQGAASGFVASNNAFVSAQTPQEHAGYALGMLQTSISAGNIIGPLVGGAISDAFGFRTVFFLVGGLCFVSFVIASTQLREDRSGQSGKRASVRRNMGIAMRDPSLRRLLLILFIAQTAVVLTAPIFPYYLQELGAPKEILASLAGIVVSIVGVATLISAPWWGKRSDRIGYQRSMFGATLIVAVGMASQAIVPSYEWIFPIRIIIGLAVGALLPLTYGELTRRAPAGNRGGIMGLASSATLVGNLTGPLLCAAITSQLPLFTAFLTASILMITVHFVSRRG